MSRSVAWVVVLLVPGTVGLSLTDPVGDHFPAPLLPHNDLVGLDAAFVDSDLEITLHVAEIPTTVGIGTLESAIYDIAFQYGAVAYRVELFLHAYLLQTQDGGPEFGGELARIDDGVARVLVPELLVEADPAAGTITALVPLVAIEDERGLPVLPEAPLHSWRVHSINEPYAVASLASPDNPLPHDRMPDANVAEDSLALPRESDAGAIHLRSAMPVRSSNGGPMTMVFPFEVYAAEGGTFPLRLDAVPAAWKARVVPDMVEVPPDGFAGGWVVIQAQGAHQHGAVDAFRLVAEAPGEPALDLQVIYPEIAAPAQHHPTLYFHSAMPEGDSFGLRETTDPAFPLTRRLWINTADEDAADEGEPAPRTFEFPGWRLPVRPTPATGIEFVEGVATATFRLQNEHPTDLPGELYWGELSVPGADGRQIARSPDLALDVPGDAPIEVTLEMPIEAQTIAPGEGLVFTIYQGRQAGAEQDPRAVMNPMLLPGGRLTLPLGEYADPIPAEVAAALAAEGALDANGTLVTAPVLEESQRTPAMAPLGIGLLGLAAAAVSRRRD